MLLLLYAQAVMGVSFDACACGGKKVSIVLLRTTTACSLCGGDPKTMDCCQTGTSFGKADQHKLPTTTQLPDPILLEKGGQVFLDLTRPAIAMEKPLSRCAARRSLPARVLLSLVQSFRI